MHPFEKILSVCVENIEFEFKNNAYAEWSNFLLNPRRLRGSDFLMRWSQGVWSEERITQAVNQHGEFFVIPYGPSGTAPDNDVRAFGSRRIRKNQATRPFGFQKSGRKDYHECGRKSWGHF